MCLVKWVKAVYESGKENLVVCEGGKKRIVATVWDSGTWHTWDRQGVGGENDKEETVRKAKIEASFSAIEQGFI